MNLSLVIPVYNEQENLPFLFEAIQKTMAEVNQSWEAILVDDGSRDKSLSVLKQYAESSSCSMPTCKMIPLTFQ